MWSIDVYNRLSNKESINWDKLEEMTFVARTDEYTIYRSTIREDVDFDKTVALAESDDVRAQHLLGWFYYEGIGVRESYRQAFYWWSRAADRNDPAAQNDLAVLYLLGRGTVRNFQIAADLCAKSANRRHAPAMLNLSLMYQAGEHVTQSDEMATLWAKRAAEGFLVGQGAGGRTPIPESHFYYAERLAYGVGVARDLVEAYRWASSAAALSADRQLSEVAEGLCTRLEASLSVDDIRSVQTLSTKRFRRDQTRRGVKIVGPTEVDIQ